MSALRRNLAALAEQFAASVVKEILRAPIRSLNGVGDARDVESKLRRGSGPRRDDGSSGQDETISAIRELLKRTPQGLGSREFQRALGLTKQQLSRPLRVALDRGDIRRTGTRRGTRYYLR